MIFLLLKMQTKLKEYSAISDIDAECQRRQKASDQIQRDIEKKQQELERQQQTFEKKAGEHQARIEKLRAELGVLEPAHDLHALIGKKQEEFDRQ
ncbi:MAG: hypothetical protein ACAI44_06045, partial [Candidatus Sericytochromatia bacterium]